MNIINIARKDMLILVKDRSTILQLFVLPLVFIILYVGIGTAATSGDEGDQRIPVPVVNMDADGDLSQSFIDSLNAQGGVRAVVYEQNEAQSLLANGDISRLIIIPSGFTESVLAGEKVAITFENDAPDANENMSVSMVVLGITQDLALKANLLNTLETMRRMQAADPDAQNSLSAERSIEQAKSQMQRAETDPLIAVKQRNPSTFEKKEDELNFAELAVPSMTVLFVFLTAQTTAVSVYDEKRTGSFRRLLAAPMSKFSLLTGKMLPNFLTVILQVVIIFFAAAVVFPWFGWDRLSLSGDIFALVLLILMTALCSTALGTLISAIAKTEAQIGGVSTVVLWVMAFIGGTIVPFFLINDVLASIGRLTPQYWAVTGFYDLLVRGLNFFDVVDSLLALLGFSVAFLAIAIWRFDFE
ncbi:MAG: ABC transporter permease [Candidatus Promineifilaceae bacterium]